MSPAAAARLRAELAAWLRRSLPPPAERRRWHAASAQERWESRRRWHRALARGGWIGVSWPEEHGGRGLPPAAEWEVADGLAAAGAPAGLEDLTLALVAPLLLAEAPAAAARLLPAVRAGEESWCLAFTERGCGADLAAAAMPARPAGRGWVLSGTKNWSTNAARAARALVLARAPQGLTLLAAPLRGGRVRVGPLRQATGESEFADLTFDGLRLPADAVVGAPGRGLELLRAYLPLEYLHPAAAAARSAELAALARRPGRPDLAALGALAAEAIGLRALAGAACAERWPPHPADASAVKLLTARLAERTAAAALDWGAPPLGARPWRARLAASWGAQLGRGTTEVHLNLLSRLGLALPREGA